MKIGRIAAPLILAASIAGGFGISSSSASAQSLANGTPYGCQINPNAPGCPYVQPMPNTPPPSFLPTTGGAQPGSPVPIGGIAVVGVTALLAGFALRRSVRR